MTDEKGREKPDSAEHGNSGAERGSSGADEDGEAGVARERHPVPERRAVRERHRHGGPSPEQTEGPREGGSKVDPGKGLGQVDKREHVPGKEPGERPQDTGTDTDTGSRGN